jgi:hypothetical protein
MGKMKNAYKNLVRKPEGERLLGRNIVQRVILKLS